VSLFWSVVMFSPFHSRWKRDEVSQGPGGHLAGTRARSVRLVLSDILVFGKSA